MTFVPRLFVLSLLRTNDVVSLKHLKPIRAYLLHVAGDYAQRMMLVDWLGLECSVILRTAHYLEFRLFRYF